MYYLTFMLSAIFILWHHNNLACLSSSVSFCLLTPYNAWASSLISKVSNNNSNTTVRAIGNTDTLLVSLLMDKLKQMKCRPARICSMDILSAGLLSHFWASSMQQPITSNASLSGWGALCKETYTGSTWSEQEPTMHINSLELLEATLALKTFLKDTSGPLVLLQLDNPTAVAYINNMGGMVSAQLTEVVKELWMWSLDNNIFRMLRE